jgi:hypothetical protein
MMETGKVAEALVLDATSTRMLTVEGFIKFNLRESFKSYYKACHTIGINCTEAEICVLLNIKCI